MAGWVTNHLSHDLVLLSRVVPSSPHLLAYCGEKQIPNNSFAVHKSDGDSHDSEMVQAADAGLAGVDVGLVLDVGARLRGWWWVPCPLRRLPWREVVGDCNIAHSPRMVLLRKRLFTVALMIFRFLVSVDANSRE